MTFINSTKPPSDRNFGLLLTVLFAGLGVYSYIKNFNVIFIVTFFSTSSILLIIAFFASNLFSPLNKTWLLLGHQLGRIINPIVLGVIFFGVMTPIAFITRILGRNELRLKRQNINTYWIDRKPTVYSTIFYKNQY